MAPFSRETAKIIGKESNWTCGCGRAFKDGWLIDISHRDNHTRDETYDDPDRGTAECIKCHLDRHISLMLSEDNHRNRAGVRLLAMRAYNKGLHTYWKENRRNLKKDRNEVVDTFRQYGLNPDEFLR